MFTLYKTRSEDGGLSWTDPEAVWQGSDIHLCEPGCIRLPDGKQLAVLLRENRRKRNSHVIFSNDEGKRAVDKFIKNGGASIRTRRIGSASGGN